MAFSGFYAQVLPGGISQNATVPGQLSQDALTVGVKREFGARILQRLQQQAERSGKMNWSIHFVDGSVIRAHQHQQFSCF